MMPQIVSQIQQQKNFNQMFFLFPSFESIFSIEYFPLHEHFVSLKQKYSLSFERIFIRKNEQKSNEQRKKIKIRQFCGKYFLLYLFFSSSFFFYCLPVSLSISILRIENHDWYPFGRSCDRCYWKSNATILSVWQYGEFDKPNGNNWRTRQN